MSLTESESKALDDIIDLSSVKIERNQFAIRVTKCLNPENLNPNVSYGKGGDDSFKSKQTFSTNSDIYRFDFIAPNTKEPIVVDENKDHDDDSLGDLDLSALITESPSPDKKREDQKSKLDKLEEITESYQNFEDLSFENELFIVTDIETQGNSKSASLNKIYIKLKHKDRQFKDLPIEFKITLKHQWATTNLDEGDTVRVVGTF